MTALHILSLQLINCKNSRYSFVGGKSSDPFRKTAQSICVSTAHDPTLLFRKCGEFYAALKRTPHFSSSSPPL